MMSAKLLLKLVGVAHFLIAVTGVQAGGVPQPSAPDGKRRVTVRDAVGMMQVGDRRYLQGDFSHARNVALFSPDGTKFVFVSQRANLDTDIVEYSLWLFRTAEALSNPHPDLIATLGSSSNREAISNVRWLPDNDTLIFLGEQPGETPQLFKVSVSTRKLEKLTNHPTAIVAYSMDENGDAFAYIANSESRPAISAAMRRRGFFVTSEQWEEIYSNRPSVDSRHEVFIKTPTLANPQRVGDVIDLDSEHSDLQISPSGQYAFFKAFATHPPAAWGDYQFESNAEAAPPLTTCISVPYYRCPEQYFVVDLEKRSVEPLINAPVILSNDGAELAAWAGQDSVILINAALPFDNRSPETNQRRKSHFYIAEVSLSNKRIDEIKESHKPLPAWNIVPDSKKDRIVITPIVEALGVPFEVRKNSSGWKVAEIGWPTTESSYPLSITLDEGINSPPRLVANDQKTKKKVLLLDLNPEFANLMFGHVELFRWNAKNNQPEEGNLYYPPDYKSGTKYPLIIQTHDESRERFWIDGPYSTANAAQPLASRGFIVLQLGLLVRYDKHSIDEVMKILDTPEEGPYYTALFESAIDELDHRGLIDRNRVGLTGFSRTVYHVEYALTHSKYRFGASVVADGINFGYASCVFYMAPAYGSVCEKVNGRPPYGEALAKWAKEAPSFALDKLNTPLLLQAIESPLVEWEVFSGLRWLRKPVELLNFYPEGAHILIRPRQRLLSQESVVDWYSFWLKGEEDPDPTKAEQYKRWRELRDLQEESIEKSVSQPKKQ